MKPFSRGSISMVIPQNKVQVFETYIKKLNKKTLADLGYKELGLLRGQRSHQRQENGTARRMLEVTVKFIAPMIGFYELVGFFKGSFNPTPSHHEIDVSSCSECVYCKEELQEYILLMNNDGKLLPVHLKCIQDFSPDPESGNTIKYFKLLREIENTLLVLSITDDLDVDNSVIDLTCFLASVIWVIEKHGWVGATTAKEGGGMSTSDRAFSMWTDPRLRRVEAFQLKQDHMDQAHKMVQWGKAQKGSDYKDKIGLISREEGVDETQAAIAASIYYGYTRENKIKTHGLFLNGEIGDRTEYQVRIESVETNSHKWGEYQFAKAKGPNGENVAIKANKDQIFWEGMSVKLKATLAAKQVLAGASVTVLERAKVIA